MPKTPQFSEMPFVGLLGGFVLRFACFIAALLFPFGVLAQGTAPQSISFLPVADRPVNSAPFQVVALASSYLPVSLSVSGPATLNGRVLTITGPGSVTISAVQAGNTQFAPASAQLSFQAQRIVPQISWNPPTSLTYGAPITASLLQAAATASPIIDVAADAATMQPRTSRSSLGADTPTYSPASSAFRYEGSVLSLSTDPNGDGGWSGSNLPAPYGLIYRVGFTCDCQQFEISFQTRQSHYRLWVDGMWTSPDATEDVTGYPGHTFVLVQFPDRRPRQIKFSIDSNAPFFGVTTPPGESIAPPQVPLGPSVMIFGDSWTGPTIFPPALGPAQPGMTGGGFPEALGEYFNFNYWTDGVGGSGFTVPGGDALGRTWVQRLQTDVCGNSRSLDQLLIVGSVNDGSSSESAIQQAAETSFHELDSCVPTMPLYYSGPQLPTASAEAAGAAASAAYPYNLTSFDIGGQSVMYGSATDSSTGNAYLYLNGHPTPLGHDFFAEVLAADLVARVPSLVPAPYALFTPVSTPGSFTYSVSPGTVLSAGSTTVSAAFTPSDTANFALATTSRQIQIRKATTSTTLAGSAQQGALLLSVMVAPEIAGTPTGAVEFSASSVSAGTRSLGTVPLTDGKVSISVRTADLPSGPLTLAASYLGDANFLTSAAAPMSMQIAAPLPPLHTVHRLRPLPPVRRAVRSRAAAVAKLAPPLPMPERKEAADRARTASGIPKR